MQANSNYTLKFDTSAYLSLYRGEDVRRTCSRSSQRLAFADFNMPPANRQVVLDIEPDRFHSLLRQYQPERAMPACRVDSDDNRAAGFSSQCSYDNNSVTTSYSAITAGYVANINAQYLSAKSAVDNSINYHRCAPYSGASSYGAGLSDGPPNGACSC